MYILQNVNIQTLNASISDDHEALSTNQSEEQDLSFDGFRNIGNSRHWNRVIKEWLPSFDPTKFLTRKISTIAPKGTARPLWIDCVKAVTHLLAQIENRKEGVFQPSDLYGQLLMWIRCMPAILLRAKPGDSHSTITHLIGRRCSSFLRGEWRTLHDSAVSEINLRNEIARNRQSSPPVQQPIEVRHQKTLEHARNLNYSRAMTALRSPGIAAGPPEETLEKLKQLHPPQSPPLVTTQSAFFVNLEPFNHIDGEWLRKLIKRTKRGTSVDQWGWDSKEMWQDIVKDEQLADDVARHWILPVAMGYLPAKYKEHLIGGRLVGLSKAPKPGVRPICVTDVWRRIAAKGLLSTCLKELKQYFQNSHPRTFQFAGANPNGATDMYHLLSIIANDAREGHDSDDPLSILTLDIKNAFNTLSRQAIFDFMAAGCSNAFGSNLLNYQGWDILCSHFSAHYDKKGILKFYHSGNVEHVLSECGIQQGDPLGSILFALAFHPLLMKIADLYPDILVTAYADNVALVGMRSRLLSAVDQFVGMLAEKNLKLNPAESLLYSPRQNVSQSQEGYNMTSFGGLELPCTSRGIKVLGSPIGEEAFAQELLEKIGSKIENDILLLKSFPYLHQRLKLATFCANKRLSYFLRTISPEFSRNTVIKLDETFDKFWAETLQFPQNYQTSPFRREYSNAIAQIRLGIRDGGCGCLRNAPILAAAHYSALAQFAFWMDEHLRQFPWTSEIRINGTLHPGLANEISKDITQLMRWEIPLGNSPPEGGSSNVKKNPLCIPTCNVILRWPQHLFPTQREFCCHIKQQLRRNLYLVLSSQEQKRLDSVSRSCAPPSKNSHLISSVVAGKSQTFQCPMALFALTNYHELSNEAVVTVTALLLGIPMMHALYLQDQQPGYADKDVWGDYCLNSSLHAAETRKTTHHSLASEITSISNGSGVSSTCDETKLPFRDDTSRKRADLMTLVGCGIQPNATLNFGPNTRLIMDVSLVHVYDSNHKFKTSNIRDTEQRKRCKYADFYQRQGFAFAPMICNTLGECGPDMLHFLWNLADRSARHHFGFHPIEHGQDLMSQSTDHDRDFRKLRGKLFNDYRLRMQTAIFEAITMRVCGRSFALTCSANYRTWIRTLQTEWHPLFPLDVPLESQHSSSVPQVQEDSQSTLASRRRPRSPTLEGGDELSRRTRRHVSTEEGTTGDASHPASSMDWQL